MQQATVGLSKSLQEKSAKRGARKALSPIPADVALRTPAHLLGQHNDRANSLLRALVPFFYLLLHLTYASRRGWQTGYSLSEATEPLLLLDRCLRATLDRLVVRRCTRGHTALFIRNTFSISTI